MDEFTDLKDFVAKKMPDADDVRANAGPAIAKLYTDAKTNYDMVRAVSDLSKMNDTLTAIKDTTAPAMKPNGRSI